MGPTRRAWLAAATSALLLLGIIGAEAKTITNPEAAAAVSTPLDNLIDIAVASRVASGALTAAQAAVAKEQLQMQFQALSAADQQSFLASVKTFDNAALAERAMLMLTQFTVSAVRQAVSESQAKSSKAQGITPKLGGDGDLVFVATAGPCRVADSRFWAGQLAPGSAMQVYVWSTFAGYNWAATQGGIGNAGAGNCVGDVFAGSVVPTAVVATITVVNTTTVGALQAWNGGTTLSGGAVLNWLAGERLSNTTVIPTDRTISPYPGSGGKRDIAVNNNSGGFTDFVIDVIGFFIENQATALDCTFVLQGASTPTPAGALTDIAPPSCPTGYTQFPSRPFGTTYGQHTVEWGPANCRFGNFVAGSPPAYCDAWCCRVPGR